MAKRQYEELTIYEKMDKGYAVSEQEKRDTIERLEGLLAEYKKRGLYFMVDRTLDSIERIKKYRISRTKQLEPRRWQEIDADIRACEMIIEQAEDRHDFFTAARWKKNRHEFRAEMEAAGMGEKYCPEITDGRALELYQEPGRQLGFMEVKGDYGSF